MNVFDAVKQFVTTRQAVEMYGLKIRRNNMVSCPFHNDRTPSMKVDNRFHCFGCGTDGDVIDFVSRLYVQMVPCDGQCCGAKRPRCGAERLPFSLI